MAEVKVEGSLIDAGTAENKVVSAVIWKGEEDVTNQFTGITLESGTLTVTKRSVTLTSETASKAYDGTALTRPDVKVSGDGFVEGEVSDLKATGTITKVDSVKNTIEYTKGKKFKEDNYLITVDEGTLTVTENEDQIVVTASNAEKLYDYIVDKCKAALGKERIGTGIFGASMKCSLVNEGPFTIILDSEEICR